MGADVVAHILDDAENFHVDLLEHGDAASGDFEGHVLRGGDDHAAIERDRLDERKLRVAGARRQIDDQDIEFAPVDREGELLMAFMIIGPRQMTGESLSRSRAMLIIFRPKFSTGSSLSPDIVGRLVAPIIFGTLGP